jgi:hypothetical protein
MLARPLPISHASASPPASAAPAAPSKLPAITGETAFAGSFGGGGGGSGGVALPTALPSYSAPPDSGSASKSRPSRAPAASAPRNAKAVLTTELAAAPNPANFGAGGWGALLPSLEPNTPIPFPHPATAHRLSVLARVFGAKRELRDRYLRVVDAHLHHIQQQLLLAAGGGAAGGGTQSQQPGAPARDRSRTGHRPVTPTLSCVYSSGMCRSL